MYDYLDYLFAESPYTDEMRRKGKRTKLDMFKKRLNHIKDSFGERKVSPFKKFKKALYKAEERLGKKVRLARVKKHGIDIGSKRGKAAYEKSKALEDKYDKQFPDYWKRIVNKKR